MAQENKIQDNPDSSGRRVRDFLFSVAGSHWDESRTLFRGGGLYASVGWRNVAEHCLMEAAVGKELADLMELSEPEATLLTSALALHDWNKRISVIGRKIEGILAENKDGDVEELQKELSALQSDAADAKEALDRLGEQGAELIFATGPEFPERVNSGWQPTLLEQVMLYIDDCCDESTITHWRERIAVLEEGRGKYLGTEYWELEKKLCSEFERNIFDNISSQKREEVSLNSPEELPNILRDLVESRIRAREERLSALLGRPSS